MDRRQRKTRKAIFDAFTELLSQKSLNKITVGEIIERADVGRATFYSHFETKDYLLKAFCEELFCHLFDVDNNKNNQHHHIFYCNESDEIFLHLFKHLKNNDNNILLLLASENNELFLTYFKNNLENLIDSNISLFKRQDCEKIPYSFWKNHIISTFCETVKWWTKNGMKESPEKITEYFFTVV